MVCWCRIASDGRRLFVGCSTAVVLVSLYIYHVHYLAFVKFDYGYNMKVNVTSGNGLCSIAFLQLVLDLVSHCCI